MGNGKLDLLLDHGLRPDRAARRRGGPRPQLHRPDADCWRSTRGPIETAGGAAPALIADIAGGTYAAVLNILLGAAAARPERAGAAISTLPRRTRPSPSQSSRAGARPRRGGSFPADAGGARAYRWLAALSALIRPRDGKLKCAAPRWSSASGAVHGCDRLAPEFDRRQRAMLESDQGRSGNGIAGRPDPTNGDQCSPAADCCVTIMATLEEAVRDLHFAERGLFAHKAQGPSGGDDAGAASADRSGVPATARARPRRRTEA